MSENFQCNDVLAKDVKVKNKLNTAVRTNVAVFRKKAIKFFILHFARR